MENILEKIKNNKIFFNQNFVFKEVVDNYIKEFEKGKSIDLGTIHYMKDEEGNIIITNGTHRIFALQKFFHKNIKGNFEERKWEYFLLKDEKLIFYNKLEDLIIKKAE